MDINKDWKQIRYHFNRTFSQNLFVSIASVDDQNQPTITPIGTLFLNQDQTGFYFEKYPSKLPKHANTNPNICALAVNSSKWYWLKSLFKGKFKTAPAIKLYGQLGERRQATEQEIQRLQRRMKATKGLKGNTYLWQDMAFVRDITFTKVESVKFGKMTK